MIELLRLPDNLLDEYAKINTLCPTNYQFVSVYDKQSKQYVDKVVHRKYVSFGISPKFKHTGKSFMFNNAVWEYPKELAALLEFAWTVDPRYNNVYVNFYADGTEYIEPHSDCIDSLEKDSKILIVNLNEKISYCRSFLIKRKEEIWPQIKIPLTHGLCILLDAEKQQEYHHWVGQEPTTEGRISVTFRCVSLEGKE